jgi:hypothetical protein
MSAICIQQASKAVDITFNVLGYIPVVHHFSGYGRMVYGMAKVITGIAVTILACVGVFGAGIPTLLSGLVLAGTLHIIRGAVETFVPFSYVICIIYDIASLLLLLNGIVLKA